MAPSSVTGNASDEIKQFIEAMTHYPSHNPGRKLFASTVMERMQLTEVSIRPMVEEPSRFEGRVVYKLIVDEDMLNFSETVHGGCIAFIIDFCSSTALAALRAHRDGKRGISVSQALNIIYHSPASLGEELRVVNTTVTVGGRAASARTEIWNDTHHRLVVSGVHIKMEPSTPQSKL